MGPPDAVGEALDGVGLADAELDGELESEGEEEPDGDAELGEADEGDPLPPLPLAEVGTGGGGCWTLAFWNSRIASNRAKHMSNSINSQDARIESGPDRS